jgi:N-acetylneuraminate synthase
MGQPCFTVGGRQVGPAQPCLIIAEIGQAHDGSLGNAHAYIDAVAKAGADAVKFQTHIAAAESTLEEAFRVPFSYQDATRYDYWKRMEFTAAQWGGLARHARDVGMIFLSTPFSEAAVDLLLQLGMEAWKVGSGEIRSRPLLEYLGATGQPILLSTGLSSWQHLDDAYHWVTQGGSPVGIFQCTTAYTCPPEKWGLNVLADIRARYGCPVGLSDHSATTHAGLAAVSLGANMLEVHVTFSRECFGPDTLSSLTISELRQLVEGVRVVERALANPVDKDDEAARLADLRLLFGKSVVAARDLRANHRLTRIDLTFKKPGTGIPASMVETVIGRRCRENIPANTVLRENHLV